MTNSSYPYPVRLQQGPSGVQGMARTAGAMAGHFDELRGAITAASGPAPGAETPAATGNQALAEAWDRFFEHMASERGTDLDQRIASLERQIHDNGVTYNVYANEAGPQRPWSLDLFPLILDTASWQHIEQGVLQRMRLLEAIMADVHGDQKLVENGWLPQALVQGHPGYLRALHGVKPVGGLHLHIAAFDLARGPDGNWWVVAQRCQAPSGLGYLLENRLAISGQFPLAFQDLRVQRLAGTYRALVESLKNLSLAGQDAHLVLLTPGPYNETYFEHAYLARYLGLTLAEGSDLIVRDERLYLRTLKALVPVHGILKRVDDQYLDPLELLSDSTLGVAGLLQVIRAGNVLMANMPGTAFLESPALLGFMPALSLHLLGQELTLPALATWWCGERSAMDDALQQLPGCVVKPTYPGSTLHQSFGAVLGNTLQPDEVDQWAGRISRQNEEFTLQAYMPPSQLPTWQRADPASSAAGQIVPRSTLLRVFVVSDGAQGWRVLPGGLARLAGPTDEISSMQRGGSSADVWALTDGGVDQSTLLQPPLTPATLAQRKRMITSRAAENLFWLGRYSERTENIIRLARLTLESLDGNEQPSVPLIAWLGQMAVNNTLVLPDVPSLAQARRVFERALISSLGSTDGATSAGYHLRAMKMAASAVRDRLSQDHWRLIVRAEEGISAFHQTTARTGDFSSVQALRMLKDTSDHMAAIGGAQADRMTRDDGWRLMSIGKHLERLVFLAASLARGLETGSVHSPAGFEAMLALFDSSITFHGQYQQSRDLAALINLLVIDRDNPHSLAWVAQTVRGRLAKLAGDAPQTATPLSERVSDPALWSLELLCQTQPAFDTTGNVAGAEPGKVTATGTGYFYNLHALLLHCMTAAHAVADAISLTYFTHSGTTNQSLGSR